MGLRQLLGLGVEERHAQHVAVLAHHGPRIELELAAAAHDDDAPARRQQRQVAHQVDVGQHLDDQVEAFPVGELQQGLAVVRALVVEGGLRPLRPRELEALGRARRPRRAQALPAAELKRRRAHAAAGPVDEDRLPRLAAAALEEGAIGRPVRDAERRALGEGDLLRQRVQLLGRAERKLGVGAAERARRVDARPGREGAARPRLLHDAGGVKAGRIRERGLVGVDAGAHVGVDGVDAGGAHPDQSLARPRGRRRGGLLHGQDLGAAELRDADRFHGFRTLAK